MKPFSVVGVLLIVVGLVALVYQSMTYTSRKTVIDIGSVRANADRQKTTLPRPPVLGATAVAGGVLLLIAGVRERANVQEHEHHR